MREMVPTASVLLLPLCAVLTLPSPSAIANVFIGADFCFPVNRTIEQQHEVVLEMKSPINLKIMVWDSKQPYRPDIHPSYRGRVLCLKRGGVLVSNVSLDDSGIYEIIIRDFLRSNESHLVDLRVFDPVSQPMVKMAGDCSANVSLSCSASKGTNATIYWRKRLEPNITYNGSVLLLNRGRGGQAAEYECVAENPISQEISRPQQPCQENPDRDRIWLILPVIVVAVLVIICCCYQKWWKTTLRTTWSSIAAFTQGSDPDSPVKDGILPSGA
ncbi:hepatocyte cell adhesion molecule-like [Callorhinchus milii]|uniref:hepatocyte cell adhesion molecule-like n=1 Tax=Callorhinchus milii TaxID=7868 RepID=UPI001C3FD15C|nr:hepatocyte cell adhesion molecule-like [Callorhinchus milii]